MNISQENEERAYQVQKALSKHNVKSMRKLMKDRTRRLHNPHKFDIDELPDNTPVSDRRKRRKAKQDGNTENN